MAASRTPPRRPGDRPARLTTLPSAITASGARPVEIVRLDGRVARVEILPFTGQSTGDRVGVDWILRFRTGAAIAGFAQITEFCAPGPSLDASLFRSMDAHSADACALYLLLKRHCVETLPALGSIAHLAALQILPGYYRNAHWAEGFERALGRIPWRRTPSILVGLPYPLEYLGAEAAPDRLRHRLSALLRFYERRLDFARLHDAEDVWIWRTQNLQARAAHGAGLLITTDRSIKTGERCL